ncbi:MAG: type II toxin-antitoxin system RelE/ParE family toxin [Chloroflexota bacterium]
MLRVRWSSHTRADFLRIAGFWLEQEPDLVPVVISAIRRRVAWIADGHHLMGTPIDGGEREGCRWYLEREYRYKIYYRIEGDPPDTMGIIAIRHGRQRPLKASTLRQYAR